MQLIPNIVRHADLLEALAPLLNLLGISAEEVYSEPPITIGHTIGFTAVHSVIDRLDSLHVVETVVGEGETAEQAVRVEIPIDIYVPIAVSTQVAI